VYQTGSPSHESVPRNISQFQNCCDPCFRETSDLAQNGDMNKKSTPTLAHLEITAVMLETNKSSDKEFNP